MFSDVVVGDGWPLAVACMRSSTTLEGSCRGEISRLISAIFSHHSAEYLPAIIASRLRVNGTSYKHNRARLCAPVALGGANWEVLF
jgi:hypothetical protein